MVGKLQGSPAWPMSRIHPSLPIFEVETAAGFTMYAPGVIAMVSRADLAELRTCFTQQGALDGVVRLSGRLANLALQFEHAARQAEAQWNSLTEASFEPECLTIYLSNECTLKCAYCYSSKPDDRRPSSTSAAPLAILEPAPFRPPPAVLGVAMIESAARWTASSCRRKSLAMGLVVHGGGEPTVQWSRLQRAVAVAKAAADDSGVALWSYLATNGHVGRNRARWLGRTFTRIGVSCDGPPDLHDRQRPVMKGALASSKTVAETIAILHGTQAFVSARTTVTPCSVRRQSEIVAYLMDELGVFDLHFEPVYGAGLPEDLRFHPGDAEEFVECYLDAKRLAESKGGALVLSGVRMAEIHGPYCDVLRQTLRITPDGSVSACFLATDGRRSDDAHVIFGGVDPSTNSLHLDAKSACEKVRRAARIPSRCHACVNMYHCARDCPDACLLTEDAERGDEVEGFRCRVQRLLALRWIEQAAQGAPANGPPVGVA